MAVPSPEEELVKAINSNFSLLNKGLESITLQLAFEPLSEGHAEGAMINVANLVSYLIGWGELALHWHDQGTRGKIIIFPGGGFRWNELGCLTQKFYRDYEDITEYEVLLARLKENKQQLVALIERFSNDGPYGKPWYSKWTRGRMIQLSIVLPHRNVSGRLNKPQKCLAEQRGAYRLSPH